MVPKALTSISDTAPQFSSSLITETGWIGAKIEKEGSTTRVYFRTGRPESTSVNGYTTDAERFAVVTDQHDNVISMFLIGSSLSDGSTSFSSSIHVSVSVAYTSEGVEIEVDAEEAVDVSVNVPSRPSSVKVNEISVKNWNYEAATGVIKIRLPTGHVVVKMLR